MTGPAGDDPAWLAVVLAVRVKEPAPVQAEVSQVPAGGTRRDADAVAGECVRDTSRGPLTAPPQGLDPCHRLGRRRGGLVVRNAGPVEQAEFTVFAVAGHPLAGAGPGNPHLGDDMGQRTSLAPLHETAATFDGQRGACGAPRSGSFVRRMSWWYFPSCRRKTRPPSSVPGGVYNVMTRNT